MSLSTPHGFYPYPKNHPTSSLRFLLDFIGLNNLTKRITSTKAEIIIGALKLCDTAFEKASGVSLRKHYRIVSCLHNGLLRSPFVVSGLP
jgi:hypothetical protein